MLSINDERDYVNSCEDYGFPVDESSFEECSEEIENVDNMYETCYMKCPDCTEDICQGIGTIHGRCSAYCPF